MQTLTNQTWTYLSDRPVGLEGDLLWKPETISKQISRIAERIVSSLYSGTSRTELSNSITFAIHGRWGMGKSSALRMIREEAERIANLPENNVSDRLKFCEYIAPAYESLPYDARTTLALRILTAVAGSPKEAIEQFLPDALAIGRFNDLIPRGEDISSVSRTSHVLERMATALSGLIDFDQIVDKYLNGPDGQTRVLVVLVDDLDRCKTDFIWHVLDSIQQLSDIRNIFFVLAVEQERLRKTVEERFERTGGAANPDYALEKYIQHAVTVPDMDADRLKSFVEALLKEYKEQDFVSKAIVENVQFLQYGLRVLTPRSVKRCLNTIRPYLESRLNEESSSEEQQKLVKERLLEYVWPDFYREYFLPTQSQGDWRIQNVFQALEMACRDFSGVRDLARLRFELNRISDRFKLDWESVGLDLTKPAGLEELAKLAAYLGTAPYWFIKKRREEQEQANIFNLIEGVPLDISKKTSTGDLPSLTESDPENEFQILYIQSETAEAADKRAESLQAAESLLSLVTHNRAHFSRRHAPMIGNIAINAERFRAIDLATRLYELALELDPEHSNNLQNFVDFIVKAPVPSYYAKAEEYISKLKSGRHAQHRPDRTLALEARLRSLTGQGTDQTYQATVNTRVEEFLKDPSGQESYVSLMSLLDEFNEFETARKVARAHYSKATTENERYLALRRLADMLAASPSESNELEAMDMYRYLMENYNSKESASELPDMLHNYATLLYKHDYDDLAGKLWFESYQHKQTSANVRRAYSLYLLRTSRPDLAAIVSEGKPLAEMVLQPPQKEMPERFREDIEHWWEQ